MSTVLTSPTRDSGSAWLGQISSRWEVVPLKRLANLVTEKADGRTFAVAMENVEGWTGRFVEGEGDYSGEGVAFRRGDILFGKLRPYLAKAWLADTNGEAVGDFHVIRCNAEVCPRFIQKFLLTRETISLIDSSTFGAKMPRANWKSVGSLLVPKPPYDEQRAIVDFLDRETAKIDDLVAEQERMIALLKERRGALISAAVTGKVDVRERISNKLDAAT